MRDRRFGPAFVGKQIGDVFVCDAVKRILRDKRLPVFERDGVFALIRRDHGGDSRPVGRVGDWFCFGEQLFGFFKFPQATKILGGVQ